MGGNFQTLKELWSGRAGKEGSGGTDPNSSPPLIFQTQQINICISQAERTFHLGTAQIVTRGYKKEKWGLVLWSPLLSLHYTYAITKGEMPTAAASVNKITKAVGKTEFTISQMAWNQCLHFLRNLLKLIHTIQSSKTNTFSTADIYALLLTVTVKDLARLSIWLTNKP